METTPYQPDQQQELNDCKEFAELLRTKYEPADSAETIFTLTKLMERFNEAYSYPPEQENLKKAMTDAGYHFSLAPQDDDFKIGFVVKLKN